MDTADLDIILTRLARLETRMVRLIAYLSLVSEGPAIDISAPDVDAQKRLFQRVMDEADD